MILFEWEAFQIGPKIKKTPEIPLILLCFAVRLCRTGVERQECLDRIRKLVAENQALIEEVHRFRTDMTYVESVARNELNLIRENEVIYRFKKGETGN